MKLFVATAVSFLTFTGFANAQISKVLDSGPDPVGLHKAEPSPYVFTIHLDAGFDPTQEIKDTMPAEFDITNTTASCGTVVAGEKPKKNPKAKPKKQPDKVRWNLTGCDPSSSQTLTITAQTDKNPGGAKKGVVRFEPGDCGPLILNEGAELSVAEGEPILSNSLVVATCPIEGEAECVDNDDDGWSIACGDCNDADSTVNPGAAEVCDNSTDENCNPTDNACVI